MNQGRADIALLAIRLFLGAAFVMHGYPKIVHPTTWIGQMLPGVPNWLAAIAAFAEFGGGIALIAGFATPIFAFLIACNMVVAVVFVAIPHGATFVNDAGGQSFEKPLAYLVMALVIILLGPGAYAVDALRPTRPRRRR